MTPGTTIAVGFLIAAIICFLLDAFGVSARVSWTPLAWACVTAAAAIKLAGY